MAEARAAADVCAWERVVYGLRENPNAEDMRMPGLRQLIVDPRAPPLDWGGYIHPFELLHPTQNVSSILLFAFVSFHLRRICCRLG